MIGILAGALAAAAANVAMGRWLGRLGRAGGPRFWRMQALGFFLRFAVIFGAAGWIWAARRRAQEVAVFIMAGAVAQMAGQIYFMTGNKKPYA